MLQPLHLHWGCLLSSRAIPSKPQNPNFQNGAALNDATLGRRVKRTRALVPAQGDIARKVPAVLGPLVLGELLGSGEPFLATAAAARDVAREVCRHQGPLLLSRSLPHQPAKRCPGSGKVDVSAAVFASPASQEMSRKRRSGCCPSAFPEAWAKLQFFLVTELVVISFWGPF